MQGVFPATSACASRENTECANNMSAGPGQVRRPVFFRLAISRELAATSVIPDPGESQGCCRLRLHAASHHGCPGRLTRLLHLLPLDA